MARPRQFDRDEALDLAVQVFWRQGFEATTMTEIGKAMGIGRQSLYDTFGDKHALFDEVMNRYIELQTTMLSQTLSADGGLESIRMHLHAAARGLTAATPRQGCLVMNTCVERAPHDPAAAALAARGLENTRTAFVRVLRGARQRGEIPHDTELDSSAAYLTSQLAGLSVLAQAGSTEDELKRIADIAVAALG